MGKAFLTFAITLCALTSSAFAGPERGAEFRGERVQSWSPAHERQQRLYADEKLSVRFENKTSTTRGVTVVPKGAVPKVFNSVGVLAVAGLAIGVSTNAEGATVRMKNEDGSDVEVPEVEPGTTPSSFSNYTAARATAK